MDEDKPSPSAPGRVIRVHLACRAELPIGSSLRVTGAHLWDPTETGHPSDPTDARKVSTIMGRDAFRAGDSGFAGGSLGMGAANVVNEDEAAASGEGTTTPLGRDVLEPGSASLLPGEMRGDTSRRTLMGIHDSRDHWYASSVEMVTCPDTYPIWRTRRPVVLVLTDPPNKDKSSDSMDDGADDDNNDCKSGVYHHHYRYLVITPGAEHESSHGLMKLYSNDGMDDIASMLSRTKISTGSLTNLGYQDTMTSGDAGDSFPVALWENPFLEDQLDYQMKDYSSRGDFSSAGALSTYSEATSIRQIGGGANNSEFLLANLPYRTLDIDTATATVTENPFASSESMDEIEDSAKYTEDGIMIDNWNNTNDITYRPYRVREGLKAKQNESDADMTLSASEGDTAMALGEEKPRIFIVCYHLPVIVSKNATTGEWQACWAESLLAKTANSSFVSAYDPHWVGTVTTNSPVEDEADKQALRTLLASMDCTVLFIDDSVRDAHYKGFCKQVLWLAFHHVDLLDFHDAAFSMDFDATEHKRPAEGSLYDLRSAWDQRQVGDWWEAFNVVNQIFAVEVAKMVKPKDVVWVHDYHLSLLPRMLGDEEKKLEAPKLTKKIFFLHIPFPVSMIFKEMECGPSVLEGILHADVVGFHGFTDARHFLSSAKRILGLSHESFEGGLIGVQYRKRTVVVTMSTVAIEPQITGGELICLVLCFKPCLRQPPNCFTHIL